MNEVLQNQVKATESLSTIDHDRISVADFIKIKPVHCQRLEEPRIKQVKKLLSEKQLPTHLEVAVVLTYFQDDYYDYQKFYVVNGNTRKGVFIKFPELIPNENLYLTIYHAFNKSDIEKIYRSIDSSNSVESSGQLIGGLCRSINYMPQSRKIQSGNFGLSLRHAYACAKGNSRIYGNELSLSDIKGKIEFNFFLEEIKFLDRVILGYQNDTAKNKKYSTGTIMAALMLIAKKYGIDNPKLSELTDSLINNNIKTHPGTKGLNDGISVINIDLYEKYNQDGSRMWTLQSEGFGPVMIGNFLYCMDNFMNDNLIPVNRQDSKKGVVMKDEQAIAYFRNYFQK